MIHRTDMCQNRCTCSVGNSVLMYSTALKSALSSGSWLGNTFRPENRARSVDDDTCRRHIWFNIPRHRSTHVNSGCGNTAYGFILVKSSFPFDVINQKEMRAAHDGQLTASRVAAQTLDRNAIMSRLLRYLFNCYLHLWGQMQNSFQIFRKFKFFILHHCQNNS